MSRRLQSFLMTPSVARVRVAFAVLLVAFVGPSIAGHTSRAWTAVCLVLLVLMVLLLRVEMVTGSLTNGASAIAGRPIALTSRGREKLAIGDFTPQARRTLRLLVGALVVIAAITLI